MPPGSWTIIGIYQNAKSLTSRYLGFIPNRFNDPINAASRKDLKWDTPPIASLPQVSNYMLVVWSFDQEEPV